MHAESGLVEVPAGATAQLIYTFDQPGTLEFACHVAGHYAAGMRGTTDEATGARIVRSALAEPARLIADNAGDEGAVVVERIRSEGDSRGYNAATGEWVDMFEAGILDPAKVTRSALQNAASIAAIVLTAESAVVEKPEEEEPAAAGGHGHMH